MTSLKYDDIDPSDKDEVDEISEYDSTYESFQSSTPSCSSVSEYRWPPCLEIEEIDQGWIRFSRTSSSKSSISSLSLNKARLYPQPWRFNWMKGLFASSGILGKPNPITPVVEQLKPSNTFDDPMDTVTMGEWGALKDGSDERSFDHRGYDGIKRIIIYYGQLIDSITIQYTKQGALEWTEKIGGDGGEHRREIVLDEPVEYITEVTGWYRKMDGISHFTFISNRKTHGPFGMTMKKIVGTYNVSKYEKNSWDLHIKREMIRKGFIPFKYSGGKLVGFKGAAGRYLSSIGFNVSFLPYSCENDGNKCIMSTATTMQHVPNISQAPCRFHQIYVDMFGYPSMGRPFEHGEYDGIKRIFIDHGKRINFFMVEYMKSGQPQLSQGVGQRGGSSTSTEVVLDHPREFLQTVKGNSSIGIGDFVAGVTSLTFYSNVRKYGPFGYERGQQFEASGGKIVGFQGTADEKGLRAIGFHIVPANSLQEL